METTNFEILAERLRNWGRWGPDDQRGTLNHIGPEALKRGTASVKQGKMFSLGIPFDSQGPQTGDLRSNPMRYTVTLGDPVDPRYPENYFFADDVVHMYLQAATQWDAFSHVHYDGMMYNGFHASENLSVRCGAHKCGIEHLACPGIASRGILLDIARLKGQDILPTDYVISPDDLNAACDQHGLTVQSGDIVLIRTGHIRCFTVHGDAAAFHGPQAGVGIDVAEWLHDHSVAAIAADNLGVEALTPEPDPRYGVPAPLHMLALRDMGCPLGEIFNLEALAADCAQDGQYSFLLSAPPLAVTGGFGSPVNPQVLK